jgi:hypothetical protein
MLRAWKFVTCEQLGSRVSEHFDQQNGFAAVRDVIALIDSAAMQRIHAFVCLFRYVHGI